MDITENLQERLNNYAVSWGLELGDHQIETHSSILTFGWQGEKPVVMKILKPGSDEHNSGRWLQFHAGRGAVALLNADPQAFLLEQAVPGTELVTLVREGRDEEATRLLCQTAANLHGESSPLPDGFPTVEDWGKAFVRNSREVLTAKIPAELLDKAHSKYRELCLSQGTRHLLHGDLHHYNVLQDSANGWLAIDPKGIIGELAYETGAMLRNPIETPEFNTDPHTITSRVKIICQELGLEEKRVLGWCFAQAVLSAVWTIEDGGPDSDITRILKLAESTLTLLNEL